MVGWFGFLWIELANANWWCGGVGLASVPEAVVALAVVVVVVGNGADKRLVHDLITFRSPIPVRIQMHTFKVLLPLATNT